MRRPHRYCEFVNNQPTEFVDFLTDPYELVNAYPSLSAAMQVGNIFSISIYLFVNCLIIFAFYVVNFAPASDSCY